MARSSEHGLGIHHFQHSNDHRHLASEGHPVGEVLGPRRVRWLAKLSQHISNEQERGHKARPSQILYNGIELLAEKGLYHHFPKQSPEGDHASFYRSMRDANNTVDYVLNLLTPSDWRNKVGLHNFTTLSPVNAREAIEILTAPIAQNGNGEIPLPTIRRGKSVDESQHWEMVRAFALADIARRIRGRSHDYNLKNELLRIHKVLEQQLFEGSFGHTSIQTTYSIHDSETNGAISIHDQLPSSITEGQHVKKFDSQMRYIAGIGYVLTNIEVKSVESSVVKALNKAILRNEKDPEKTYVDADEDVRDTMRMMFAVKGTSESSLTDPRVNSLKEIVHEMFDRMYTDRHGKSRITWEEDKQNGDSTQSDTVRYQKVLVHVEGLPVPIELIFQSEIDYINYNYRIGKINGTIDENSKDAEAHRLYAMKRALHILPLLFPPHIEKYQGLRERALQSILDEAEKLRMLNRVDVPVVKAN